MPRIRRAHPSDLGRLVEIWLNSVRATHHFLTDAYIDTLLPEVRDVVLPSLEETWILCGDDDVAVGFMALAGQSLEALFIDPSHFRRGGGRHLVEHARRLKGRLTVSVNEQNPEAIGFYAALGFQVIGRSPDDGEGRPFPLLHMREATIDAVVLLDEVQCRELEAFLVERICEFNSEATGCFDGKLLGGSVKGAAGDVVAGFSGHTWGACCQISNLWVSGHHRGRGVGQAMLRVAEAEALRRGCVQVVLRTHSFQAPEFYERLGYDRKYAIEGVPAGHSDIVFIKVLRAEHGQTAPA